MDTTKVNEGKIVQSIGAVIDIQFPRDQMPRIYDALIEDRMDPELLARVHAPIGLDLGAITPQEIAVSILAELIAVRRGRAAEFDDCGELHAQAGEQQRVRKRQREELIVGLEILLSDASNVFGMIQ